MGTGNIWANPVRQGAGEDSWYARWFESPFYQALYAHRDEKEAADFIDVLLNNLEPPGDACMLDLGCGQGRHAKQLASKGFRVTGIDLSFSGICEARKAESPRLRFFRHDMRNPFGQACYDYIFSFFTSFGYFSEPAENYRVIGNMAAALKTGGTLVMDYLNTPYAESRLLRAEMKEINEVHFRITRWTDPAFFYKKVLASDAITGKAYSFTEQVARFSLPEFDEIFRGQGLRLEEVFGDYQLSRYDTVHSPRLIMLARKE